MEKAQISTQTAKSMVAAVSHWHHRFEIAPGILTPGSYDPGFLYAKIGRASWEGARCLDVGPSDGFFSKQIAENGGQVVALDYRPKNMHGFSLMEQLSSAHFDYRVGNVFGITETDFGLFDTVLLLGVLYHLPDPLRALWACRMVCRGNLYLETWYDSDIPDDVPLARYISTMGNPDFTNFWVPNRQCLLGMVTDAGFDVIRDERWGGRMFLEARISDDKERLRRMRVAYSDNVLGL